MKKAGCLLLVIVMSLSLFGCNESEKAEKTKSNDQVFVEEFSKAINKRWTKQDKLEKTIAKDDDYTEEEYNEENAKILEEELKTIEKYLVNVEDKELKELGSQYVEGAKLQIEMFKTTDWELEDKYGEESAQLRKPALIALVDEYDLVINEEHEQNYKDFKEQATIINKENEAEQYADKLAQEISFEKTVDEYDDVTYTAIVENGSDLEFDSILYDVQFKDSEGIVVGNDIIALENFTPGTKQKVKLSYVNEETKTIQLSLDYFELK